ncbi:hypothetical protein EZJ43_06215 [Pedobacter changchengzhani]|uniref:Uncharacterized protein n=1 Tax=Pedobacter changchengzhani TaxID=2529274 RepID=A0A4R5MMH5_9SPHI|nr:hypothetical protein EZJ43_06215 [Pedobacter changchengzhani]
MPTFEEYNKYGQTYNRFFIDPWYRPVKRNPPIWFFKLMVGHFKNAFDRWEEFFFNSAPPYDLQIWLFNKTFIRSEIYCAKVDHFGQTRNIFTPSTVQKSFPEQIFGGKIKAELEWVLCDDFNYFDEEDFLDIYGNLPTISKNKFIENFHADGRKYYTFKIGDVWVGRLKCIK